MQEAGLKLGPLMIQPIIFIRNAGYDSNIYRTAGNTTTDYVFTIGPAFNIYLPIRKKIIVSFYESPQYMYYVDTKRERSWNNYFNGQIHFSLRRFFITLGRGFSDAKHLWNTEIDIRLRRKEDNYQGSVLWQATKKTSFDLKYRQIQYDFENIYYEKFNIDERLSRKEKYFNFSGYYQLSYRTKLFLDFEYGFFNFNNPASFRNSKSYGINGGFEFSPLGSVRGRINLGYKYFNSLTADRADYRGIVGDSSVSVKLLKVLRIRVVYTRDLGFSLWYNNTFFLSSRYGGGVSFYLSRKIRLDYDYSLGKNNYPQSQSLAPGSWEKRFDEYGIHSVGIYFRLKRKIGIGLIASRWVRNSNLDWEDDKRDFIGVNLIYDF